jgi:hypothetical protein
VGAELCTFFAETDMMEELLNNCSSICSAEGSPETLGAGASSRCSDFPFGLAALPLLSEALCRLMASKTLPIVHLNLVRWQFFNLKNHVNPV